MSQDEKLTDIEQEIVIEEPSTEVETQEDIRDLEIKRLTLQKQVLEEQSKLSKNKEQLLIKQVEKLQEDNKKLVTTTRAKIENDQFFFE